MVKVVEDRWPRVVSVRRRAEACVCHFVPGATTDRTLLFYAWNFPTSFLCAFFAAGRSSPAGDRDGGFHFAGPLCDYLPHEPAIKTNARP